MDIQTFRLLDRIGRFSDKYVDQFQTDMSVCVTCSIAGSMLLPTTPLSPARAGGEKSRAETSPAATGQDGTNS